MSNNVKVSNNFATEFKNIQSINDLKVIANALMAELKKAYDERFEELKGSEPTVNAEIKVETAKKPKVKETKTAKVEAPAPEKPKAKGKAKEVKGAKKTKAPKKAQTVVTASAEELSALNLEFKSYNERCMVLTGDTKPLRKELRELGGVYNSRLSVGEGWVFRNADAQRVCDALGVSVTA